MFSKYFGTYDVLEKYIRKCDSTSSLFIVLHLIIIFNYVLILLNLPTFINHELKKVGYDIAKRIQKKKKVKLNSVPRDDGITNAILLRI